jgi:serine/threonine protein kinase
MIFEFADGGTLQDYLKLHISDLTWENKYKLAFDIINGLKYLHKNNIAHKDMVRYFV